MHIYIQYIYIIHRCQQSMELRQEFPAFCSPHLVLETIAKAIGNNLIVVLRNRVLSSRPWRGECENQFRPLTENEHVTMSNFEDPTIEAVPISIIFFATAFQFQIQHEKSQAAASSRRPGWGHPTCHESLQPWGQGMLGCCWLHQNNGNIIENCFNFCSIFHLCAPFAGTGTDVHQKNKVNWIKYQVYLFQYLWNATFRPPGVQPAGPL